MAIMLAYVVGSGALKPVVTVVSATNFTRPEDSEKSFDDSSLFSYWCDYYDMVEELGLHDGNQT